MQIPRHIFLSYRRDDALALAGRIADHLEQRFPWAETFYDIDSIAPGVNFRQRIQQALEQSRVLLAVVDRNWAGWTASGRRRLDEPDDWVALELRTAAQLGVPVIPIIDPYARMPSADMLPADLAWFADQQAFSLHKDIGFDHEMARLDGWLVDLLPQPTPRDSPAPKPPRQPGRRSGRPVRWLVAILLIVALLGGLGVVVWRMASPLLCNLPIDVGQPTVVEGRWTADGDLHGVRLAVTEVSRSCDRLSFRVQLDNRSRSEFTFGEQHRGEIQAIDDQRRSYAASPFSEIMRIKVPSGEQLVATLDLDRGVEADARTLSLRFSHRTDPFAEPVTVRADGVPVPAR